jgi:transposase-like protein
METTMVSETRHRWSAADKEKILAVYPQREGTQAEFCREQGVSVPTLAVWLRKSRAQSPAGNPGLVELRPGRIGSSDVLVELLGGVTVRVPPGTEPRWLAQVIAALRCGA